MRQIQMRIAIFVGTVEVDERCFFEVASIGPWRGNWFGRNVHARSLVPAGRSTLRSPATRRRNSRATRSITGAQAPRAGWRKSRAVGYQGVSSRCDSQIQSATYGNRIHTGLPKAPARCTTAVSLEMTKSSPR